MKWKDRLRRFLKPLDIWNETKVWADDCIDAGADWFEAIKMAINDSAVAILLVTTDFLGTEFIAKEEIPDLLRLRSERGMWVIPVLISHCPWESVRWLKRMNIVPEKATPLYTMDEPDQDAFLSQLANDIDKFLEAWEEPEEPVEAAATTVAPAPTTTIDFSHLPETSATLFGRDAQLDGLDADWESADTRIVAFVAQGGEGKSALVKRWLHDMEADGWRDAERVFGWSFYSQGARDQGATAEMFFDTALRFFGDPDPTQGSAWDKGERLARLVAANRTLLVLDGMEPLQSLHDFERGRLRDPGLQALLRGLVRESAGLCIISTREPIPDLDGRDGYRPVDLSTITPQDGRALLRSLRVVGHDAELEALATEFGPHALSVTLLGTWLYEQPGHAASAVNKLAAGPDPLARVLAGFEELLGEGPALDLLRTQGLFDRPAPDTQVAAALDVESLDAAAVERLRDLRLLAPHRRCAPHILEAHPLIREHYNNELRHRFPDLFRDAHRRIYEHLRERTKEGEKPTLEDLQPLYQAVAHGCHAGLQEEACAKVYRDRILRGTGHGGFYSTKQLGAFGSDLGAVACFFETPWSRVSSALIEAARSWILMVAAFDLRALGRLTEALEPMRVSGEMDLKAKKWGEAARSYSNLSQLELTLGQVAGAVDDAAQSVTYADRSGDTIMRMITRATRADALQQAGKRDEAEACFRKAEQIQAELQPDYPLLYSLRGFLCCDQLMTETERAAWQKTLRSEGGGQRPELTEQCREVEQRATQTLKWSTGKLGPLDEALDHLTLGRAALYRAILGGPAIRNPESEIETAVDGLRRAAAVEFLVRGLLTRAWLRFLDSDPAGSARDLDEAWEIADRGPMKLFMVDIHLYRARLFGKVKEYPWDSPQADLDEAARLIEETGYHRRDEELADAREAAKNWY
ncbi:MAG: toll/interleukin-1 receptor domain-containing protein [Phycisphaerales bacterium]|nr:MAG: toll/interleukin-1 receptor domain-containing protein [Phycisphaerales bacterium]